MQILLFSNQNCTILMKTKFIFLSFLFLPLFSFGQCNAVEQFFDAQEDEDHVLCIDVPGWLVRLGGYLGRQDKDEVEAELIKEMTHSIRRMQIMAIDSDHSFSRQKRNKFIQNLDKDNFEKLSKSRTHDSDLDVYINQDEKWVRNVVLMADEDDDFLMISMKTKLSPDLLDDLIESLTDDDGDIDVNLEVDINKD